MVLVLLGRRWTPLCTARSVSATSCRCPIAQTCVSRQVGSHDRAMDAPSRVQDGAADRRSVPRALRGHDRARPVHHSRSELRTASTAGMPRRVFGRRSGPGPSASRSGVSEWSTARSPFALVVVLILVAVLAAMSPPPAGRRACCAPAAEAEAQRCARARAEATAARRVRDEGLAQGGARVRGQWCRMALTAATV